MHPLLYQHLLGDLISPLCPHWVPQHPNGHDIPIPCSHTQTVTVGGHFVRGVWVPDVQVAYQHKNDGTQHVPCTDLIQAHPNGNCNFGPCGHPLVPTSYDSGRNIIFYTGNSSVRSTVAQAYDKLVALGVAPNLISTAIRPLLILNHAPATNGSQTDPAWSRYDAGLHAIQIMTTHPVPETVFHEIGHAIVGQSCVRAVAPGLPHNGTSPQVPGDALSEGWAEFVAGSIAISRDTRDASFGSINLDAKLTPADGPPRKDVETFVARTLWDLFDTGKLIPPPPGGPALSQRLDDEPASLSFASLYGVWMPTAQTMSSGPLIPDLDDYIHRLKLNNPGQGAAIDAVMSLNFPQ